MVEDPQAEAFGLPEAFMSAFASAHDSDARMGVVEQFFEREEITPGADGTMELKPTGLLQVYLVGTTSLIHIERQEPPGTFHVVQPVQRKRGSIAKSALEDKIVSEVKKGRKLWLLTRKVPRPSPSDVRLEGSAREPENRRGLAQFAESSEQIVPDPIPESGSRIGSKEESLVAGSAIHLDEIVPETSATRLSAVDGASQGGELDLKAFGQLRTMLQNVRLQFWNGNARSQATESITVAARKAEERDITGAIQAIEALENVFVRLIEQWEIDFREAERRVKRSLNEAGDKARFKTFKEHHSEMQSRITQTKTKFRIMLNWLRELETKLKIGGQGR
jgi:hypothetical protein